VGKAHQQAEGQKPSLAINTAATDLETPMNASPFDRRMSVARDASPDQAAQGLALDPSATMMTKVSLYSSISRNQRATIYEDQDGEESKTHDDQYDGESINKQSFAGTGATFNKKATMRGPKLPQKPLFAAKPRIKTPTKEGYAIYKEYKEKVRKIADEKKLPLYMQSKFKAKLEA
tara:strand:- start:190 stop:717 length:528 start_codon:yes stop_codon:yes gene_type:complete